MNVLVSQLPDPADQTPEPFSVAASVSLQERRYRTIKSGDTFGVFDHGGDIVCLPGGTDGLYHRDTRHLSQFDLTVNGAPPLLLSSMLGTDSVMLTSDMVNGAATDLGAPELGQGAIHVQRSLFLADGACHGRLAVRNFAFARCRVRLELRFAADFADLFEVRGMRRERRGQALPAALGRDGVTLAYRGLDDRQRATRLVFEPPPQTLTATGAVFQLELEPRERATIFVAIDCASQAAGPGVAGPGIAGPGIAGPGVAGQAVAGSGEAGPTHAGPAAPRAAFLSAYIATKRRLRASAARSAAISSRHEEFDQAAVRAADDLRMLVTDKRTGPYPYAGIPWFSTAFGRDALITALLVLAYDPALAAGVLRYLAQEQATETDPATEAEPGKILHEVRGGEMAALGEIPFRRYYGSVDATPLFVMLAGAYLERTSDLGAVRTLWPHINLALDWIDRRADADGFVSYRRSTEEGLANQGWKDSYDAISHADGTLARGAIALCEVQGYAYAARRAGAAIARQLGFESQALALLAKAEQLRSAFEARFWCERLGTYALALDGDGQQCQVRASNAGHLLMTGIAAPSRARRVAEGLMSAEMFSGWGIRTLAASEARYNPMSYHNGSVWPHDNAVIALGMARVGMKAEAARLFEAMYAAACAMDLRRLPELFCGFRRRPHQGPTSYPVACSPQAWAAAALPAFVQASLGLGFDPAAGAIRFEHPHLPAFLDDLTLRNLGLAGNQVSVLVKRTRGETAVSVVGRGGGDRVQVVTTL